MQYYSGIVKYRKKIMQRSEFTVFPDGPSGAEPLKIPVAELKFHLRRFFQISLTERDVFEPKSLEQDAAGETADLSLTEKFFENPDPVDILDRHTHILFYGADGFGKSTLCRYYAAYLAADIHGMLPVQISWLEYHDLKRRNPSFTMMDMALRQIESAGAADVARLKDYLSSGNVIWLIDDVSPPDDRFLAELTDLARLPGKVIIFTDKPELLPSVTVFSMYELAPFRPSDRRHARKVWERAAAAGSAETPPQKESENYSEFSQAASHLPQNTVPFYVALQFGRNHPSTHTERPAQLCRAWLAQVLPEENRKTLFYRACWEMTAKMIRQNRKAPLRVIGLEELELLLMRLQPKEDRKPEHVVAVIQALIRCRALSPFQDDGRRFLIEHPLWLMYGAAEWLTARLARRPFLTWLSIIPLIHHKKWQPVLTMAASLMPAEELGFLVKKILSLNLIRVKRHNLHLQRVLALMTESGEDIFKDDAPRFYQKIQTMLFRQRESSNPARLWFRYHGLLAWARLAGDEAVKHRYFLGAHEEEQLLLLPHFADSTDTRVLSAIQGLLFHSSETYRILALNILQYWHNPVLFGLLKPMVSHQNRTVRFSALILASAWEYAGWRHDIGIILKNDNAFIKTRILTMIGQSRQIGKILPYLVSEDDAVIRQACRTLVESGGAKTCAAVLLLLKEKTRDWAIKNRLAGQLVKVIGKTDMAALQIFIREKDKFPERAELAYATIIKFTKRRILPYMIPYLSSPNPVVKTIAVETVARVEHPRTLIKELTPILLSTEDVVLRERIVNSVPVWQGKDAVRLLSELTKPAHLVNKAVIIDALSRSDRLEKLPRYMRLLKSADPSIKQKIIPVFAKDKPDEAWPVIKELARHSNPDIRKSAICAMRYIDHPEKDVLLEDLLKDSQNGALMATALHVAAHNPGKTLSDELTIIASSGTVAQMEPVLSEDTLWKQPARIRKIWKDIHDHDEKAVRFLTLAKGRADRKTIATVLRYIRKDPTPVQLGILKLLEHEEVAPVIHRITPLLKDKDWQVRYQAVRLIGKSGDSRHVLRLLSMIRQKQLGVHHAAVNALAAIILRTSSHRRLRIILNKIRIMLPPKSGLFREDLLQLTMTQYLSV